MKKKTLFGLALGLAAGTAAAVAVKSTVDRISKEIRSDIAEEEFDSPLGNNWVTVSRGSSESAKGLTYIRIKAECDSKEDDCKLVLFAGKNAAISGEWEDNEHFRLLVGNEKHKQCCDVSFDGEEITARYYLIKIEMK